MEEPFIHFRKPTDSVQFRVFKPDHSKFATVTDKKCTQPPYRYFWVGVVRGTDKPVIISLGQTAHRQIVNLVLRNEKPVKLPWYKRLWNWLLRRKTPTTTILDPWDGQDVVARMEKSDSGFPRYSFTLAPPSPLGTPDQIAEWTNSKLLKEVEDRQNE